MSKWADSVSGTDSGLTVADLKEINATAREAIDTALDQMKDKINTAINQHLAAQNGLIDFTNISFLNKSVEELLTSGAMFPPSDRISDFYMSRAEHEITNAVEFLMYGQSITSMAEGAESLIDIDYPRTFEELQERINNEAVTEHFGYISEILKASSHINTSGLNSDITQIFADELEQVFSQIRDGVEELKKQRRGSVPNTP